MYMTAGFADMIKLSEHDYQACKAMDCSQNSVVSLTASCRKVIKSNHLVQWRISCLYA